MLDELSVRNLALIEEARLCPGRGLVVVSGETGTGKTLLLGALRLLLGSEARGDLVGPYGDETVVEGRFLIGGEEFICGRRIPREGRSRAYLDGSLASSQALAERLGGFLEIVGQHDQMSLTRPAAVRELVDGHLDPKGRAARDRYREALEAFTRLEQARQQLGGDQRALSRELDLVRFQADEIEGAGFAAGEDVELERRAARLRHREALLQALAEAAGAGEAATDGLGQTIEALRRAARLDPGLEALAADAGAVAEALTELTRRIRLSSEELAGDGEELTEDEGRLTRLGDLKRKYGSTLEEVLAFAAAARQRSRELEQLLEAAASIEDDHRVARGELEGAGKELAAARRRAGKRLGEQALIHLRDLGMEDPTVKLEVEEGPPEAAGADRLQLLFASDRRLTPGEVGKVASGGELSRLILSLRLAGLGPTAGRDDLILAFDEIDAGVGGATALQLGKKLGALAADHQVLCVTHLPQVAAFADTHFVVERAGNRATVGELDGERRISELSRMLAGLPDSARGQQAAEELVALARGTRRS
jgi:DNA repair protein RecN (Recombination protein N)